MLMRPVILASLGVVLIGGITAEEAARRGAERRYQEAVGARRKLELQFGEVLATHNQLKEHLGREQQRSHALSEELLAMRGKLEEAVGRLGDETKTVAQLQMRLAAMQQQMDQLQGEVSFSMGQRPTGRAASPTTSSSASVQLERIVVSDAASSGAKGRILSVHKSWNFVVIDLGWNAVRVGDVVSIFRDDQLLAKARVDRVQEGASAATLLPEWEHSDVRINDLVRIL